METNLIEKMDKAYYASMVRLTVLVALNLVVFVPLMGLETGGFFVDKPDLHKIMQRASMIISAFTFLVVIWHFILVFKIRKNKEVRRAVENGEFQQDAGYKASKFGFFTFLFLSVLACNFSVLFPAYAVTMLWALFLLGTLSMLVAWLHYNR